MRLGLNHPCCTPVGLFTEIKRPFTEKTQAIA